LFYSYYGNKNVENTENLIEINGSSVPITYKIHEDKFIIFAKEKIEDDDPEGFFVGTCKYSLIRVENLYNRGIINFFDINDNKTRIGTMFNLPLEEDNNKNNKNNFIFGQTNKFNNTNPFINGHWEMYKIENNDECANAINTGTIVENNGGSRSRKSQRNHKSKKYARKTIRKHKSRKNRN
jgi:hypothetical protein